MNAPIDNHSSFLLRGGEMGELIRQKNWSITALGNQDSWPQSLRITLNIIMNSHFPMFLWWGPELICFYNDAYRPSLGENGKHPFILGIPAKEAWPEIWHIIKPLIDQVLNEGKATWSEDQLVPIYRNGKIEDVYWTFSYSPVIDESGGYGGILVTCTETTEKINNLRLLEETNRELQIAIDATEMNEKRFRQMAETIPEIAWVASPHGSDSFYNKRFYEYTGMTEEEAHRDWKWEGIVHPSMFEARNKVWEQCLVTGNDFYFESLLKRNSDQSYRWHISRATAVRNNHGEIITWVGTSTDIHEQKLSAQKLETVVAERTRALQDSISQLKQSNENLEQFASIASHDLQEPLRKIQTFTGLLLHRHSKELGEEPRKYLNKINFAADRMSLLIRDVLHFSKLTQLKDQFEITDLNMILNNVMKDLELVAEKAMVIIKNPLPHIDSIPVQMNQLFYNLLANAIKFSKPETHHQITIDCKKTTPEELSVYAEMNTSDVHYQITIADNGIGFDQQFSGDIFMMFHRLSSDKYRGTGIGLALCKRIVDIHHGRIFAEGIESDGATFYIILPEKQQ